jgi:hypothetical protein
MLADPDGTLAKLDALRDVPVPGRYGNRVHIRMDDVVSIDAPSLLYFCSNLRWLSDNRKAKQTGSYPTPKEAIRALRDGGFLACLTHRSVTCA